MFDDSLHEQLADWVRPVTSLPIPDVRILRRRARRRGMRRVVTVAVAPYIVIPGYGGTGGAQVRNMFTGRTIVTIKPLPGQYVIGAAAAGAARQRTVSGASLSWAGDRTLAFEWLAGDNRHPPGLGLRVLNIDAPGNLLQASRLVIPYGQYCGATAACQDGRLLTPDGSKMLVTRVAADGHGHLSRVTLHSPMYGLNFGAAFAW
jgi:hypothetical protein